MGRTLHFTSAPPRVSASFSSLTNNLPCREQWEERARCSNRQLQVNGIWGERACLPVSIYKIPQSHSDWASLGYMCHAGKVTVARRKKYCDWPGQGLLWLTAPLHHTEWGKDSCPKEMGHALMRSGGLGQWQHGTSLPPRSILKRFKHISCFKTKNYTLGKIYFFLKKMFNPHDF